VTRPRQGRLVVLLNGAIGVALIAVIAGISVFRQDAHPPGIAEFAPAGSGKLPNTSASAVPNQPPPLVRTKAQVLGVPKGARGVPQQVACYGWPDGTTTQTFDPQSPPCTPSWEVAAGNGGGTSRGVTATAVRVGVPRSSIAGLQPYADFFNTHFQLYGRSLVLVPLGKATMTTDEGQAAAAAKADEEQVFATLVDPPATAGPAAAPTQFLNTASAHGVIALLSAPSQASSTGLSALAPYAWSYEPGFDELQTAAGSLLCQELVGRRARFSPDQSGDNRRLGLLVPDAEHAGGNDVDVDPVATALATCHSSPEIRRFDPTSPGSARDALLQLKLAGVTTVLPYVSDSLVARVVMPAAESDGYRPEWLLTGIDAGPDAAIWAKAPTRQVRALFGLAGWSPQLAASPAARAVPAGTTVDEYAYHALLILASGVQLAGPRLTPDTFAGGLADTAFANPGGATRPLFQASVGFDDHDHAMVNDVALAWWQGKDFCLVGAGSRWGFNDLPANDPGLFLPQKGCR
jgi:hypothetical protein